MKLTFKLFIILIVCGNIYTTTAQPKGNETIDSLHKEYANSKADTNRVNILNGFAENFYSVNPDSGIKYSNLSINLSKKLNWQKGLADGYSFLGINNSVVGNYDDAFKNFKSSLEIYEKLGDKQGISKQLGYLGIVNMSISNFTGALEYYQKALKLEKEEGNTIRVAKQLGNMGMVYTNLQDFPKALEYSYRALKISEELGDKVSISRQLNNIALNYTNLKNYEKALDFYQRALKIDEELNNTKGIAIKLGNIGVLYRESRNYIKAFEYIRKALTMNEEIGSKSGIVINLANMGELHFRLTQDSIIKNLEKSDSKLNLDKKFNLAMTINYVNEAKDIALAIGAKRQLIEVYHLLDKANESTGNFKEAYQYQTKWVQLKDSIFSVEKTTEIANLEAKKENEINEKEIKLKDLELSRKDNEQLAMFVGLGAFAIVLIVIILQRRKSEKLLLNILPEKIAKRLKKNEKNIADRFEEVSIIFVDIVGFTLYSRGTEPEKVVTALNDIFTRFDMLSMKHGLEKIKTIGDCYMAVAGLPEPNANHAHSTALFALEAKDLMHNYTTPDGHRLQFRIGIDSGPVVAGVIGDSKFSYDLWGDAVNMASRMESTGLPNEIQITENFMKKIQGKGIKFQERGKVEIKGKGLITTYLIR